MLKKQNIPDVRLLLRRAQFSLLVCKKHYLLVSYEVIEIAMSVLTPNNLLCYEEYLYIKLSQIIKETV